MKLLQAIVFFILSLVLSATYTVFLVFQLTVVFQTTDTVVENVGLPAPRDCINRLPIVHPPGKQTSQYSFLRRSASVQRDDDNSNIKGCHPILSEEQECGICREEFRMHGYRQTMIETPCKHLFHKKCLGAWLERASTCPICRTNIPAALQSKQKGKRKEEQTTRQSRQRQQEQTRQREELRAQAPVEEPTVSTVEVSELPPRIQDTFLRYNESSQEQTHQSANANNESLPERNQLEDSVGRTMNVVISHALDSDFDSAVNAVVSRAFESDFDNTMNAVISHALLESNFDTTVNVVVSHTVDTAISAAVLRGAEAVSTPTNSSTQDIENDRETRITETQDSVQPMEAAAHDSEDCVDEMELEDDQKPTAECARLEAPPLKDGTESYRKRNASHLEEESPDQESAKRRKSDTEETPVDGKMQTKP